MNKQVIREKFTAIVNICYLLHVVAGTIIVVSIRNQQPEEGKEPKVKLDDLDKFLRFFLLAMEIFCTFSVFCLALQPPNPGGKLQVLFIMFFNGLSSFFYIKIMSLGYGITISAMWCISGLLLFIASPEEIYNQLSKIREEATKRVQFVRQLFSNANDEENQNPNNNQGNQNQNNNQGNQNQNQNNNQGNQNQNNNGENQNQNNNNNGGGGVGGGAGAAPHMGFLLLLTACCGLVFALFNFHSH
jgi:hypothetical protein